MAVERTTPYPAGLYPEQLPSWLTWAATWAGRSVPDTTRPFRYLDLGCGIGHSACWVARCYPRAEVVGIDADTEHVRRSRALAAQLGVDVRFEHGTFDEVQVEPADFVVLHGVWSWIDDRTRLGLVELLDRVVAEGGLVYVDHNALPGRADWAVLASLVRAMVAETGGGTDAEALDRSLQAVAEVRPELAVGLVEQLRQAPGYLVHELLSAGWRAFALADVAAELRGAGLRYVGSTHLWEAVEAFRTTDAERAHLARWSDPVVRHTVRDALRGTAFRHDVYQRGGRALSGAARRDALLDRHHALGRAPHACPLDRVPGHDAAHPLPARCAEVVAALDGGPRTGRALASALSGDPDLLVGDLGLLCAAGYVFPADRQLFDRGVDDLMALDVDLLPVLSPSGIEVTFTRADRALWRAWGEEDVVGTARAHLAAEGHPAERRAVEAELAGFQRAVPDLRRAGFRLPVH